MNKYLVCAAYSQEDANSFDRCSLVQEFETAKEAKSFAKHSLTEEYQQLIEASAPLNYAKVESIEGGHCLADYFRKGYKQPVEEEVC